MPEQLSLIALVASLLLAAVAGLNPYLPLFILAVMSRFTGQVQLNPGYGFLKEYWFIALTGLLFLLNIFGDKIFLPGDSIATPTAERTRKTRIGVAHDLGQMILGPLAGALLLGATSPWRPASMPLLPLMMGVLLAALVYAGKRAVRHRLQGRLGIFSNQLWSIAEDLVVVMVTVLAILVRR